MRKNLSKSTGSGSSEPHLEVIEYGADDNGQFEIDDEGDPKEGFYWRVSGDATAGVEIGPYPDFDAAEKAGRQAWADSAY